MCTILRELSKNYNNYHYFSPGGRFPLAPATSIPGSCWGSCCTLMENNPYFPFPSNNYPNNYPVQMWRGPSENRIGPKSDGSCCSFGTPAPKKCSGRQARVARGRKRMPVDANRPGPECIHGHGSVSKSQWHSNVLLCPLRPIAPVPNVPGHGSVTTSRWHSSVLVPPCKKN